MTMPPSGNIAAHLPAMAASRPDALAIVQPRGRDRQGRLRHRHYTFRELDPKPTASPPASNVSASAAAREPC